MTLGWIEYIIIVVSSAGGVIFSKSADDHFDHSRTSEKSMTMNILDAHSVARCGGALLRVKIPPAIDILPCVEVNIDNAFELSRDSTLTFRPTYYICRANTANVIVIREHRGRVTGLQMYTFDFCCSAAFEAAFQFERRSPTFAANINSSGSEEARVVITSSCADAIREV